MNDKQLTTQYAQALRQDFTRAMQEAYSAVEYGERQIDEHTDGPATMRAVLDNIGSKLGWLDTEYSSVCLAF